MTAVRALIVTSLFFALAAVQTKAAEPPPAVQKRELEKGAGIAALALSARDGTQATMVALWLATFNLKSWYVIWRGDPTTGNPLVVTIEGKNMVAAFSDKEQAIKVATFRKIPITDIRELPTAKAARICADMKSTEVTHVLFDLGTSEYFAPLENLAPMYEYYFHKKLPAAAASP